jgi:hypothetical protein
MSTRDEVKNTVKYLRMIVFLKYAKNYSNFIIKLGDLIDTYKSIHDFTTEQNTQLTNLKTAIIGLSSSSTDSDIDTLINTHIQYEITHFLVDEFTKHAYDLFKI